MMRIHDRLEVSTLPNDPRVAHVKLSRPTKLNALDLDSFRAIEECFTRILPSAPFTNVRCVVLSGEGPSFCAGIDLSDPGVQGSLFPPPDACPSAARLELYDFIRSLQRAITVLETYTWPVIVACHGAVVGGGVDLACAADVRICASDASFCVKEVDVGIVADLGTLQRLPPIVGQGRAAEWALTARIVSAAEALASGLVSEVQVVAGTSGREAVEQRALAIARGLAAKPPLALRGTKRFLLQARDARSVEEGLRSIAQYNMGVLASHELRDKLAAFNAKGAGGPTGGDGQQRPARLSPRSKL